VKRKNKMGTTANKPGVSRHGLVVTSVYTFVLGVSSPALGEPFDCVDPVIGGDETEMCELLNLDATPTATRVVPFSPMGVSSDGSVVVGTASSFNGYIWTEAGADIISGTRTANAVTPDGSIVVGQDANGQPYRWTEAGGEVTLSSINANALSISADGLTIVGQAIGPNSGMNDSNSAWYWSSGAGLQDLNLGANSTALDVSSDGSVIVGWLMSRPDTTFPDNGFQKSFLWDATGGTVYLGDLGGQSSLAFSVSADGGRVVGESFDSSFAKFAFLWTADDGMQSLGTLPGDAYSTASAISDDGLVVVGQSGPNSFYQTDGNRAFRWTEDTGMESLGVLTGDEWSFARGINDDGSIVVGQSGIGSSARAFIWRAPSNEEDNVGGVIQDYANLLTSFPVLANDSAVAAAQQQQGLGQTMGQGFFAGAGQFGVQMRAGFARTDRNPTTVGARSTSLGAVSLGYGVSDGFTVGATASFDVTGLNNNGFDMGAGQSLAAWARYSAGGAAGTGLQAEAAIGWGRAEGELMRGRLLNNVALATGTSSLQTWGFHAAVGYGFEAGGGWLVTPNVALTHYRTTRPAYDETGAPFNASYDEMQVSRTDLTLGVTGEIKVSAQGTLSFGAGIERALGGQDAVLSGTSDIPGLATFNIPSSFVPNQTRGYVSAGYAHDFGNGMTLSGDLRVGHAVYGSSPEVRGGIALGFSF